MSLFATATVKELKNQAGFIGGLHGQVHLGQVHLGQVHLGQVSDADLADVVGNEDFRRQLRAAYSAAVADVGEQKAMKAAVTAARQNAESYARLGQRNQDNVQSLAEQSIHKMLGS